MLGDITKAVVPIVEFYDFDEYELLLSSGWIKDVMFNATNFTPMWLFWLYKIQKVKHKSNNKYLVDLRDILKMFKTKYTV